MDLKRTATAVKLCFSDGPATMNRYVGVNLNGTVRDFINDHQLLSVTDTGNNN